MEQATNRVQAESLIALLTEQRDLYGRLRGLSERQRTLITGDQPELLLNILRERQTLVGALARLNEHLAPYRREWERFYAGLPGDLRQEATRLLAEVNGLLKVIMRTDQEDSALLSARKQAVASEIGHLSGGRTANAAYGQQAARRGEVGAADMTG